MGAKGVAIVVVSAALVAGCRANSEREPPQEASRPGASAQGASRDQAECGRPHRSPTGFPELRGLVPHDGQLWALVFGDYPARAGRKIKIAWKMTGDGPVTLYATRAGGGRVDPLWGPESHTGSNWERPGDEWGSGWLFQLPGCWTVHLVRGSDHGTAGIRVTG